MQGMFRFRTCQSLPSTNSGRAFRMAVKKSPCLFSSCMPMERHNEPSLQKSQLNYKFVLGCN